MTDMLIGFAGAWLAMAGIAAVVWHRKRMRIVRVRREENVVQVTIYPGDWVIAGSRTQAREYVIR